MRRGFFLFERDDAVGVGGDEIAQLDIDLIFARRNVEGLPITQWCDEQELNLNSRLRLFQKLCDAVQFAHQNLVVHRDLKPANVLVTSDGEPKLLDFGIAKLTDPASDATRTFDWALTLVYASPQQVCGGPITTAADIYSLGVLFYEPITGERLNSFSGRPLLRSCSRSQSASTSKSPVELPVLAQYR